MMITLEAWTRNIVEMLIRDYGFNKKKAKRAASEMKDYYNIGMDEQTAIEECVLDLDPDMD